jgi:membrane fusion protein, multidrug efflux system
MAHRSFRHIGIILLLGFVGFACSRNGQQGGAGGGGRGGRGGRGGNQVPTGTVSVETTKPQRIAVDRAVDLSGTLISPDQARVSSEVAGKVMDVLFEIGQEVNTGAPLVTLETTELQLALDRAESALRQTEAQLGIDSTRPESIPADEDIAAVRTAAANRDDARAQLTRAEELLAKGLLSKADMDTAQTRVKVSEASYQSARENVASLKASLQDRRAAWDLAKKKLADATVRAPVAGAIAERIVQRGEYIRENTQVATIVRMNPLKFKTAVQEKYANMIHQNQPVRFSVEAFPNESFAGKIAFISPAVDQTSRTFAAEVLVDNPARKLKPGFFAQGHVNVGRDTSVIAVPEETISSLAGVSSVFVIKDNVVRQQTVEVGQKVDKLVEVISGLKGDETIAASNLNQLVTGVRIAGNSGEEAGSAPDEGSTRSDAKASGERGGRGRGGRSGGGE